MFLDTCPNQFGFKKGHSTDMCIYVLKEFIEFYRSRNTSVFVTFLDASKAYDKIDHWQLFNKLLNIHVPVFIICISIFWYSRQEMLDFVGDICIRTHKNMVLRHNHSSPISTRLTLFDNIE